MIEEFSKIKGFLEQKEGKALYEACKFSFQDWQNVQKLVHIVASLLVILVLHVKKLVQTLFC